MTAAPSASQAFAAVDFTPGRESQGVWEDSPYDIDALHGALLDRLLADFVARTRAEDSNPPGHVVSGPAGAGKSRLISALRRKVWDGGGWFVRLDAAAGADFWLAAVSGFQASLSRRMKNGRTQAGAVLSAVLQRLSADRAARAAAARTPPQARNNTVEKLLAMLAAFDPAQTAKRRDIVRALALADSGNPEIRVCAAAWMQGRPGDRVLQRELGFSGAGLPPREIVEGLIWILALAGPILVAVEGIDAAEATDEAHLLGWAAGLAELHKLKRRAMLVVACREASLSIPEALRPPRALPGLENADLVERVIVARLAPAYAQAGFVPPYRSFPFTRKALESGVGLTPHELLARCGRHQQACQGEDGISECVWLTAAAPAPYKAPVKPPPALVALPPPPVAPVAAASRLPAPLRPPALPPAKPNRPSPPLRVLELAGITPAPAPPVALTSAARLPQPLRARESAPPPEAASAAPLRVADLAGLTAAPVPVAPPAPPPPVSPPPVRRPAVPPPPPSQRELTLGRSAQVGEVVGPIALSTEILARHVAVIADAGRGALMSRIVEEAALTGVPALVLDLTGELSRLGEPWPSRPTEFTEEDARKAKLFRERVEGVLWTPGLSAGRPLALDPLPDFAGLARGYALDDGEERARAADMAAATVEPFLTHHGPRAIKMRGAFVDAFTAFGRMGGGDLDDFLRLLADLPANASRLEDSQSLAREIAVQLVAARAVAPLLQAEGEPLDPAEFFESPNGRVRISVVNLAGLSSEAARTAFVNNLYVALLGWLQRQPSPQTRLLVIDEAHLFAPLRDASAARRSTLALLAQARKYGLALMFGTREPRNLDPAITTGALTHLYGPMGSPEQAKTLSGLLVAKGVAGDEAERVRPPEFLFASEGHPRPIRIRTPLTLSRRTLTPPSAQEIAALSRRR